MGTKLRITTRKIFALAACLTLILLYHFSNPNPSDIVIRLHADQIDIQKLTNAIAGIIIEKGYGYKVEKVESTIKEVHGRLIRGDIDITLEMWKANNLVWYDNARNQGRIVDLGSIYSQGRQYWIIPRWYAEEKGVKTVFDMKAHWQDFMDPEDPSKGLFFNCIYGWACRDINRVKLAAYGLDRYFNTVSPTSPKALKSIYESARARRLPVFGYYWEPNALMTNQDWYRLEEPDYSEAVWRDVIESAATPGGEPLPVACAYNTNTVHKIAHSRLMKKAPDVVDMFKKMEIPVQLFNDILFKREQLPGDTDGFRETALFFLDQYREQWGGWVTPEVQEKLEKYISRPWNRVPE
ncbi:MAG: hypothetical protein MI747_13005 [Desulfobacterales bacterium]|nr:hypothetical protein [Desulfobacterales bacterium]